MLGVAATFLAALPRVVEARWIACRHPDRDARLQELLDEVRAGVAGGTYDEDRRSGH